MGKTLTDHAGLPVDDLKDGVLRNARLEGYQGKGSALSVKNAPVLKQESGA